MVTSLAACAPTIDGSSEEAMEASIDAMKESLPAEQQAEFEQALQLIAMDGMNLGDLMQGEKGAEQIIQRYAEDLDGLTAEEVIAKGEAIEAEQARKKKAQGLLRFLGAHH